MNPPESRLPPLVTLPLRDDDACVQEDTLTSRNGGASTSQKARTTSSIVSWNIGLRGLRQLTDSNRTFDQHTTKDEHGVSRAKGYGGVENLLASLGEDVNVVCLQETKLNSKDDLSLATATPSGWDSFFSICRLNKKGKTGYAGVAVYFRSEVMVFGAEEGITGMLAGGQGGDDVAGGAGSNDGGLEGNLPGFHSSVDEAMRSRFTHERMTELESEGRCLVVDFGTFVLINVYVPAVTSSDEAEAEKRVEFKKDFLEAVEIRYRALLKQNRHVVLCGDWNVSHMGIDSAHAPKLKSKGEVKAYITRNPGRAWLERMLNPTGNQSRDTNGNEYGTNADTLSDMSDTYPPLLDVFRHHYPQVQGAYTCWNISAGAQLTNHGSRIDYFLSDIKFHEKFVTRSGVAQKHEGSDHCPVFITVRNEVWRMRSGDEYYPPSLASSVSFASAGRQTLLAGFFVKNIDGEKSESARFPSSDTDTRKRKQQTKVDIKSFFRRVGGGGSEALGVGGQAATATTAMAPTPTTAPALTPPNLPSTTPTASKETVDAWRRIQQRQKPPKCKGHGEECKVRKVSKQGPNFGRVFFACPRPAGDVKNGGDCGFFQWAYDRK